MAESRVERVSTEVHERPAATTSDKVGRGAIIIAALVGGWFLYNPIRLKAENYPWEVGIAVAIAVLAAVGYYRWQDRDQERARLAEERRLREDDKYAQITFDDPRFRPNRSWVAPVAIVLVAAVWGVGAGASGRDNYLRAYCEYGSRSAAQLAGCMRHVNTDDINKRDTQAARFARGENSNCLADAGPYCEGASSWNTIDPSDLQP
jgi:hypothetical protein